MSQLDTKTRILNAAEQLFARDGFHNTSMRSITGEAEVNLAAVNYHFGSKDALLKAVFERHLLPLNRLRQELLQGVLDAAGHEGCPPAVDDLMRAFIEPTVAFRKADPGHRAFIALIGRSMVEMDSTVRDCFVHLVEPLFLLLFRSLQRALPELPQTVLLTRLRFALSAMAHTMCMPDQSPLQIDNNAALLDVGDLSEELIRFTCAGLEAPC